MPPCYFMFSEIGKAQLKIKLRNNLTVHTYSHYCIKAKFACAEIQKKAIYVPTILKCCIDEVVYSIFFLLF
jgi:hypothetical protein